MTFKYIFSRPLSNEYFLILDNLVKTREDNHVPYGFGSHGGILN